MNCSGAMYIGVPSTLLAIVMPVLSVRAMPKSAILMRPLLVMMTLDGLTSRCHTPCSWAWPKASTSCTARLATSASVKRTRCDRYCDSVWPSTNSIAM